VSNSIQKATTPKAKTDNFMLEVSKRKDSFARLLPSNLKPEWFEAEVRVAVARTPRLMECDPVSVFDAITTCAQLGLSPSDRLGSAYLIPYGQKCTLVVGYRGMVDLAYRSGEVVSVGAQVVHANDHFKAHEGFDLQVEHERTEDEPGPVYAWANTKAGGTIKVLMLRREVEPIKRAALAKKRQGAPPTPWETNEEEMWKKTALRRLFKVSPLSPQKASALTKALEVEDAAWEDIPMDAGAEDAPTATGTAALKKTLAAKNKAERIEDAVTEQAEPTPAWKDDAAMSEMAKKQGLPMSHPGAEPPEPGSEG
jgi:recombination protein RecT